MDLSSRFEDHLRDALVFQTQYETPLSKFQFPKQRMQFAREEIARSKTNIFKLSPSRQKIDLIFAISHPLKTVNHCFKNFVAVPLQQNLLRPIVKLAYKMFIQSKDAKIRLHNFAKVQLLNNLVTRIDDLENRDKNLILSEREKDQVLRILKITRAFEIKLTSDPNQSNTENYEHHISKYIERPW